MLFHILSSKVVSKKASGEYSGASKNKNFQLPLRLTLCESKGREIFLFGTKNNYNFYGNIKSLEEALPKFFIHPNRSYFVNYEFITCFKFEELIMTDGSIIPISRNKRKEIRELQLVFERKGQLK